jgi:hypothetical protein
MAIAALVEISALAIVPSRIIVDVTVPVSPVVTAVPVTAGRVIVVVPAVAFALRTVVPDVEPLNVAPPEEITGVVKDGLVPKDVSEEPVTPEPSVVADRTDTPLISYTFPVTTLRSSDDVHAVAVFDQVNVLSVVPFRVIPPPSAVVLVGDAIVPSSIFLSDTVIVLALIIVLVPETVRFPPTVTFPFSDVLPDALPMANVVAAPAMLTVVAVVLTKSNDALDVVIDVLIFGLVLNMRVPVPLSSVTTLIKLAELGVARNVATLAPRPLTPVEIGSDVPLLKLTDCGVPRIGVTRVGELENTNTPVPVSSETTPAS